MAEEVGKLTGYKCKNCGKVGHIVGNRCPRCNGTEFEKIDLGEECRLLTYTQIYNPPAGVDVDPPLMIGLLECSNGIRVTGQLDLPHPDQLELGRKYKPEWGKLRRIMGEEVYGFKFKLPEGSTKKGE